MTSYNPSRPFKNFMIIFFSCLPCVNTIISTPTPTVINPGTLPTKKMTAIPANITHHEPISNIASNTLPSLQSKTNFIAIPATRWIKPAARETTKNAMGSFNGLNQSPSKKGYSSFAFSIPAIFCMIAYGRSPNQPPNTTPISIHEIPQ